MKGTKSTRKRTTRAKKTTTRAKSKTTRRSRPSRRQLLTVGTVTAGLFLIFALLLYSKPAVVKGVKHGVQRRISSISKREIASNAVYGQVLGINVGSTPRGTIRVKSLTTGKVYTFYLGWRTNYYPARYPYRGEKVKVYYVNDRGYLKATQVTIYR